MEMLLDAEWKLIAENELTIHCPRMKVIPANPKNEPTYSGSGTIIVRRNEPIHFEMSGTCEYPETMMFPAHPPGTLITTDMLYWLDATDLLGREWTGVGVQVERPISNPTAGSIEELHSTSTCVESAIALRMFVPKVPTLPISNWHLKSDDVLLGLNSLPNGVEIAATSANDLGADYVRRLEESLWFVTGIVTRAIAYERRDGASVFTTITTPMAVGQSSRFRAPTRLLFQQANDIGRMFLMYLKYAQTAPSGMYHQTSADLRLVHSAGTGTIEQAAIAASIALEALIRREFLAYGEARPEQIEEVSLALETLETISVSDEIRRRLRGAIGAITSPSPRSALRALVSAGLLRKRHRVAWESTRHAFVHGSDIKRADWERIMANTQLVHQAFLVLVLHRIGYSGPVNDLTRVGFPLIQVPLPFDAA